MPPQEPNNSTELCGLANASQAFDSPFAWGWADADCRMALPFMCKAQPAGSSYVYISPTSKVTYVLETTRRAFVDAQYSCNQHGGHLAHYETLEEQVGGWGCVLDGILCGLPSDTEGLAGRLVMAIAGTRLQPQCR